MKRILVIVLHLILFPIVTVAVAVLLAVIEYVAFFSLDYFSTGSISSSQMQKSDYLWLYWLIGALAYPAGYSALRDRREKKLQEQNKAQRLREKSEKDKLDRERLKLLKEQQQQEALAKSKQSYLQLRDKISKQRSNIDSIRMQFIDQSAKVDRLTIEVTDIENKLDDIKKRYPNLIKITGVDKILKEYKSQLKSLQKVTDGLVL